MRYHVSCGGKGEAMDKEMRLERECVCFGIGERRHSILKNKIKWRFLVTH